ncbi:MAG: hypothetical protein JWN99_1051 [Ilumatobacteraceae bacterium]|nr:hypothetical protein [Ilumatobacteraceae bacterium]
MWNTWFGDTAPPVVNATKGAVVSTTDWKKFERDLKKQVEDAVNKDLAKIAADVKRNPRKYVDDQTPWQPDPVTGEIPPEPEIEVIVPKFKVS